MKVHDGNMLLAGQSTVENTISIHSHGEFSSGQLY